MAESDSTFMFKKEHRRTLNELLWPARAQYMNIYIALGFDPSELHASGGSQISDLYMDVVEAIISKGVNKQELVDALKSPTVGHGQLALNLEKNESIKDGANDKIE